MTSWGSARYFPKKIGFTVKEKQNIIEIKRVPELTLTGKISTSMEHEGKNYKITIKKK